mgnify:CR=1 FL=1
MINKLFNWIHWESKERPTGKILIKVRHRIRPVEAKTVIKIYHLVQEKFLLIVVINSCSIEFAGSPSKLKKFWSKFHHRVQYVLLSSRLSMHHVRMKSTVIVSQSAGQTKIAQKRTLLSLSPRATARLVCVLIRRTQLFKNLLSGLINILLPYHALLTICNLVTCAALVRYANLTLSFCNND